MPWIALPARSPPSTITSGWYTAAALTNFRKHLSEPCRSVAKYSRVDRPTGSVNRGMRALPVDHLDHLPGPAGVHGIPGVPIHFQTGAHDHPVAVGQDLLDILLVDAGIRQQRQVGYRLARGGQVGHLDAGAGGRPADQDRIESEERRAPGSLGDAAPGDRTRELGGDIGEPGDVLRPDRLSVTGQLAGL